MNGQLLTFAGSLAAVVILVLASWALGLGRGARIVDESEAQELADNAICGFEVEEVALDAGGHGALLLDGKGRIMLLAPHGAQFAARLLDGAARTARDGARLTVDSVTLDLGAAAGAWETRLRRLSD